MAPIVASNLPTVPYRAIVTSLHLYATTNSPAPSAPVYNTGALVICSIANTKICITPPLRLLFFDSVPLEIQEEEKERKKPNCLMVRMLYKGESDLMLKEMN